MYGPVRPWFLGLSGRKRMHPPPRRSRRPHGHRATLARSVKDSAARSVGSPEKFLRVLAVQYYPVHLVCFKTIALISSNTYRKQSSTVPATTTIPCLLARSCGLSPAQVILLQRSRQLGGDSDRSKARSERRREELAEPKEERPATRIR